MAAADYTDAVHNFILSQKLTGLLGDFPEVCLLEDFSNMIPHTSYVSSDS